MVLTSDGTQHRIYGASHYVGRIAQFVVLFVIASILYATLRESGFIALMMFAGIAIGYAAMRLFWWIEARSGQIVTGGLLRRSRVMVLDPDRNAYPVSEIAEFTIPRSKRQYIVVPQASGPDMTVKHVWRRAPWGDESKVHPQLVELITIANIRSESEESIQ